MTEKDSVTQISARTTNRHNNLNAVDPKMACDSRGIACQYCQNDLQTQPQHCRHKNDFRTAKNEWFFRF